MGKHRDGLYIPVSYIFVLFVTHNSQPHTKHIKSSVFCMATRHHTRNTSNLRFFVWLRDIFDRAEANDVTTTPRQEQVGSMRRNEREKLPVHTSAVLGVL